MQFAKGITSGYIPLGGIGVSDTIRDVINGVPAGKRWMHAFTYSGHPTCCAVALANIDILEREQLVARSAAGGARLLEGLRTLESDGLRRPRPRAGPDGGGGSGGRQGDQGPVPGAGGPDPEADGRVAWSAGSTRAW